jgi:hypothetical protein
MGAPQPTLPVAYDPRITIKKALIDGLVVAGLAIFADQNVLGWATGLVPDQYRLYALPVLMMLWTAGQNWLKHYKRA